MLSTPVTKQIMIGFFLLWQVTSHALADATITQYELDNGLKVILQPDHRSPTVDVQVWYAVGGIDEPKGITGASHALEHMMFNGTRQVPQGEFHQILNRLGATYNAFTSNDYTAYHCSISSHQLPVMLALEADRMRNLTLAEETFVPEHQVILEEWRSRYVDNPDGYAMGHYLTSAFPLSPYRQPVLGWPDDIKSLTTQTLKEWYHQWYHPNNATLVIVGDIQPDQVKAEIEKYFSKIPSATLPKQVSISDLEAPGQRSITVQHPQVSIDQLYMGFNVPAIRTDNTDDWEPYALRMLAGILGGGGSARLNTTIVHQKELATHLDVEYDPFARGDRLLLFTGSPNQAKGISSDQVIAEIQLILDSLKKEPPTAKELARVHTQLKAHQVFAQDDNTERALNFGALVTLGFPADWQTTYYRKLAAVTPEQIQQVARKYLIPTRLSTGYLQPKTEGKNNGQ